MRVALIVVASLPVLYVAWRSLLGHLLYRRLTSTPLRRLRHEALSSDEVAIEMTAAIAERRARLEALGFTALGWVRVWPRLSRSDNSVVLFVANNEATATIATFSPLDKASTPLADFETWFSDQTRVETLSGSDWMTAIGPRPGVTIRSSTAFDLAGIYREHLQSVSQSSAAPAPCPRTTDDLVGLWTAGESKRWDALVESGWIRKHNDGAWWHDAAKIRAALPQIMTSLQKNAALNVHRKPYERMVGELAEKPRTDAEVFQAVVGLRRRRASRLALAALGVAIVLPLLVGMVDARWFSASFLGIAYIAHELGHQAVLRWYGFRRPGLFLASLFGAPHAGYSAEASVVEVFWIHAMGALPGLLIGGLLLLRPGSALTPLGPLDGIGLSLLTVSSLSLLPLLETDGARILDLIIFPRAPRLGFTVQATVAIVIVAAAGAAVPPMLVALLPLARAMLRRYRIARIRGWMLKSSDRAVDSPTAALHAVREAGFGHLPFDRQCELGYEVLENPIRSLRSIVAFALLVAYLAAVAAGPAIFAAVYRKSAAEVERTFPVRIQ